jgi:TRAP-type C4-dicarboxylate transport system permease small subunit
LFFQAKLGKWLNRIIFIVTSVALLFMMVVVVANVTLRDIADSPIWGAIEVIGLTGIVMISFALSYTEKERGHITVSILTARLSQRVQSIFSILAHILSLLMVTLLIWGGIEQVWEVWTTPGSYTIDLHLNYTAFKVIWVVGCLIFFGYIMQNLVKTVMKVMKK